MTSPDPLGGKLADPQTLNKYTYVRNSPVTLTDPTGLYTCADDQNTCQTKHDLAFQAALENDLNSKDPNVVRAAQAYGDPTKDNGVTIKFGDPGNGRDAVTSSGIRQDPNDPNKHQASEVVTLRPYLSGSALGAAAAHEGSHVADAQDFANAITASGEIDQSKNLTSYQTELKAYMVTQSILAQRTRHWPMATAVYRVHIFWALASCQPRRSKLLTSCLRIPRIVTERAQNTE